MRSRSLNRDSRETDQTDQTSQAGHRLENTDRLTGLIGLSGFQIGLKYSVTRLSLLENSSFLCYAFWGWLPYNARRPHQELEQECPEGSFKATNRGAIYRHEVLGGQINDYYREVA